MDGHDSRGDSVSGSTPAALQSYEHALDAFVAWRSDADEALREALRQAPAFVMAHVLEACRMVGSRDPQRVRGAHATLAVAAALHCNEHEQLHLAALARVLADDYEGGAALFGRVLLSRPRDLLALAMACGIDYMAGEATRMRDRMESVLPAWSADLPGYHGVQAMHAFSLVECGDFGRAEEAARAALAADPADARAHHAMAHVFEMTDRPAAGLRWMNEHASRWGEHTVVATHCWWHMALFHLALGEPAAAIALYDRRIRADHSLELADLIDAAALLWRLHLKGVDLGARWAELANAWAPRIDEGFCSFSDLHAMLAFVGAGEWSRARELEQVLMQRRLQPTRHGIATRELGLPACRGLMAFGRGDHPLAITLLASLPAHLHRLGGSHAQREVLHLTLLQAIERMRRPRPVLQHTRQIGSAADMRGPQPNPRSAVPDRVTEAAP